MDSSGKIKTRLTLSFVDVLIGILIVLFCGYWLIIKDHSPGGKKIVAIYKGDLRILELPMNNDQVISLNPFGVGMVVEILNQKVRVSSSDCPQQICVRKGWTGLVHDLIICMPNQITVSIEGDDPEYDAISH